MGAEGVSGSHEKSRESLAEMPRESICRNGYDRSSSHLVVPAVPLLGAQSSIGQWSFAFYKLWNSLLSALLKSVRSLKMCL